MRPSPGAIPTGRLAKKPMRQLASEAMAAVVVIRSRLTSETQAIYESGGLTTQSAPAGQTQVPPVSMMMEAFTEICVECGSQGND